MRVVTTSNENMRIISFNYRLLKEIRVSKVYDLKLVAFEAHRAVKEHALSKLTK